jgi:hypothetical protein
MKQHGANTRTQYTATSLSRFRARTENGCRSAYDEDHALPLMFIIRYSSRSVYLSFKKKSFMKTTGSVSESHQPSLLVKHKATLAWLSVAALWKKELVFFQKLLEVCAKEVISQDDKKRVDHFQSIITFYRDELVDQLSAQLRLHEKKLADVFGTPDIPAFEYLNEHERLMTEIESMNSQLAQYKEDLYTFVLKILTNRA